MNPQVLGQPLKVTSTQSVKLHPFEHVVQSTSCWSAALPIHAARSPTIVEIVAKLRLKEGVESGLSGRCHLNEWFESKSQIHSTRCFRQSYDTYNRMLEDCIRYPPVPCVPQPGQTHRNENQNTCEHLIWKTIRQDTACQFESTQ